MTIISVIIIIIIMMMTIISVIIIIITMMMTIISVIIIIIVIIFNRHYEFHSLAALGNPTFEGVREVCRNESTKSLIQTFTGRVIRKPSVGTHRS